MYLVPILLGAGCVIAIAGAAYAGMRQLVIALMLAGVWIGAMILWQIDYVAGLSILDAIVGLFALWFAVTGSGNWAFRVVMLCWLRLGMHVLIDLAGGQYFVGYAHALNATFAAQLAVMFWTGGGGVVSHILHIFRSRYLRHPVGSTH